MSGGERPRVVCHLIASNFYGGPERQIVEHCSRLDPARWRPVVGSFRENRTRVDVVEKARDRGIAAFLIDTRWKFSPDALRQLHRVLSRFGVDLLVTHGYKANLVGYLGARFPRLPQVPFARGFTGEDANIRTYERIDRFVLKRFRTVFCVSEALGRDLGDRGRRGRRMITVHNGVDPVPAGQIAAVDLHREFGIPAGAPVLAAAGRLSPEKGQRFLIEALSRLPREHAGAHLVLLGSGVEQPALERLALELGVGDRVHFAGFRTGILGYLKAADLVVNPSLTEGLPNVLLEAHVAGTPVVATRVGGVPELVIAGETGWLVEPGDPGALARALAEALDDPGKAREMADAARRRVETVFSFELQTRHLVRAYEDVLRQRGTAAPAGVSTAAGRPR
jgi:glycosyltransferase involved in cell wall biosynthesis